MRTKGSREISMHPGPCITGKEKVGANWAREEGEERYIIT